MMTGNVNINNPNTDLKILIDEFEISISVHGLDPYRFTY
jgi:hypothetical protein